MAHSYHNIENTKFNGAPYYVAYGGGCVWHVYKVNGISKPGVNWRANATRFSPEGKSMPILYGKTLCDISEQLETVKP